MSIPTDQQLDAGEVKVLCGFRDGLAPRVIARETFLAMLEVKNPVGKPRVHDYEALLARLVAGEAPASVFRGIGNMVRQRVLAMFRERGG